MNKNRKGILYACITALFWGFLAILLKIAVKRVDSITIVWFRFLFAFLLLLTWELSHNKKEIKILIHPPIILVFAAIALTINYLGYMFGIRYTTPSNGQIFAQAGPLLFTIGGIILFKERLNKGQILGFIFAIAGFTVFYSQQIKIVHLDNYNLGVMSVLTGSFVWAIYALLQKKLIETHSSNSLNLFLYLFPALVLLPFIDLSPFASFNIWWWLLLMLLGLNTLIAYGCLAQAIRYTEANKVSIIVLLNPIITFVLMGILTFLDVSWIEGEHFTTLTIIGALIVLFGAGLVIYNNNHKTDLRND